VNLIIGVKILNVESMRSGRPVRAVIFDFDGVLVNSEPLHFRALRDTLAPEGIEIDEDEYASCYLAYNDREALRIALERHSRPHGPERVAALVARKSSIFDALLPGVPYFPGARDLVLRLARRVPLAIASGALHDEIERILEAGRLRGAFHAVVGAEDVSRGKPHPEPYLTALGRLRLREPALTPDACLVFEDSVPGILAARAAGMRVVGVAQTYPAEKLAPAHHVVASLEELASAALDPLLGD
jgi:beta-phosphoglucomutase-like phosphatase (HAD superfamily)